MTAAQGQALRPRLKPAQIVYGAMALLCVGIAGYALVVSAFDRFPPPVAANAAGLAVLVVHATCAAAALLIGPIQFMPRVRARRRRLHRWLGRSYCVLCLTGGVAGAALALGTTSGPVARFGFLGLAIAWLGSTALAWSAALRADFATHRMWMIRSFALTFAAVTLRLYLPISMVSGIAFSTAYPVIAWLCWVPNLAVAEAWIRRTPKIRA